MSAPVVFVSPAGTLDTGLRGGVQICTDEFLRTFRAAGYDVRPHLVAPDWRLPVRIRQRLRREAYPTRWQPGCAVEIARLVEAVAADFVCLNLVNLAPLARELRSVLPSSCRIVLLSHGLESVDYLHAAPSSGWSWSHERGLGRRVLQERRQRSVIDHVFCLTSFEVEIEQWLGARSVTAVPRTRLDIRPLDWQPDRGRLGFVGTLDHPPTHQGLVALLEALKRVARPDVEIRIVGGPEPIGRALAGRFANVRYLGPLDDEHLRNEASTWSAFLHPMFCWARGCSTKLAVALAWELPIATTPAGARGYAWGRGDLRLAVTPEALADTACALTDPEIARQARRDVQLVGATMPTVDDIGALLRDALTPGTARREAPA